MWRELSSGILTFDIANLALAGAVNWLGLFVAKRVWGNLYFVSVVRSVPRS